MLRLFWTLLAALLLALPELESWHYLAIHQQHIAFAAEQHSEGSANIR